MDSYFNKPAEQVTHRFPRIRARYEAWFNKRLPEASEITLTQRRIFILPSKMGILFSIVLILLLLMAINYQNSMIFAYTFFLSSLFPVAIIFTFRNLEGLVVGVSSCSSVFVGESAKINLVVSRNDLRQRQQIHFKWPGSNAANVNLLDNNQDEIELFVPTARRGVLVPQRLYLHTRYPLGFLRAWSWLRLKLDAVVFPKPIEGELPVRNAIGDDSDKTKRPVHSDEISGFRAYIHGDSPKQIAWKSYAATGELNVKQFEGNEAKELWLDFNEVRGGDLEYKLSVLCYWVLQLDEKGCRYGLSLPDQTFDFNTGSQHRHKILRALAFYNLPVSE
ncbi:MAG: DUF58 domain-containing protein [Pseudomonadales bacterium]|nr:DUF58 domain-containing protein [Pseudomonadales bacterium]